MTSHSILSPHGEGYCRHCRFVVGLDADGLMDHHTRGSVTEYGSRTIPEKCKGSGAKPAKVTPYAASKNRFLMRLPMAVCPVCGGRAAKTRGGRLASHGPYCAGSGRIVQ